MAEQLYVRLVEDTSAFHCAESKTEDAIQLLLDVMWDGDLDPPGNVREARNQVADLLEVQLTDSVRKGSSLQKKSKVQPTDEFASYMSLLNDTAR
jgi:hypothetical protein